MQPCGADQMLDKGDLNGRDVWVRIIEAIRDLQDGNTIGTLH